MSPIRRRSPSLEPGGERLPSSDFEVKPRLFLGAACLLALGLLASLLVPLAMGSRDIAASTMLTLLVLSMILGAGGFYLVRRASIVFGSAMLLALIAAAAISRDSFLATNVWYLAPSVLGFALVSYYARRALERLIGGLHDAEERMREQNAQLEAAAGLLRRKNEALLESIEEARRARLEAEEAGREKELLLHEVHHRVKNNLQIIISMLNLQAEAKSAGECRYCYSEVTERVRSMAMVHELLYESDDLASVDFAAYLRRISSAIVAPEGAGASLELRLEPCSLELDRALPCGLIVTEALMNALKYGRGSDGIARITVALAVGEPELVLEIADRGAGFPQDSEAVGRRFGRFLMATLAEQAGCGIAFENRDGARVRLDLRK